MPPKPKSFVPRKLLVAALGVATINFVGVACGGATDGSDKSTFTNGEGGPPPTSGNLAIGDPPPPTSGNLAPPPDASFDADAANDDGGDGGDGG